MAESMEDAVAKAVSELDYRVLDGKKAAVNAERVAVGVRPLGVAPKEPDVPACDWCGLEFSANLICSKCKSAFYCSKECQKSAWKGGCHKQACDEMNAECLKAGTEVVAQMKNTRLLAMDRVEEFSLKRLDSAGPYKAAVESGLHSAMQLLFQEDEQGIRERFLSRSLTSFTQWIMVTLFRGQRAEGRRNTQGSFGCIDAQRIKSYVLSDPEAFGVWMNASLAMFRLPLDREIFQDKTIHQMARMSARDIWAAWIMVFTKRRAARAIILGKSGQPDEAAVARAKEIARCFKDAFAASWKTSDSQDPGGTLEGCLNQVSAMVAYWIKEFNVKVDFEKLLGMKGFRKQKYLQMAVPLAEGTIAKQGTMTSQEAQVAMTAARRGR
jgi:hypothetical protein